MTGVEPVEYAARAALRDAHSAGHSGARPSAGRRPRAGLRWGVLLDVLEERTRRLGAAVETGQEVALPDLPLRADGPLPSELGFRARVVLAETERLTQLAERRKASTERELHYRRT